MNIIKNAVAVGCIVCVAGTIIGMACVAYATAVAANLVGF